MVIPMNYHPIDLVVHAERCVIECPYYDSGGTITDEQVHAWYEDEYECLITEEVRMLDAFRIAFGLNLCELDMHNPVIVNHLVLFRQTLTDILVN